MREPFLWGAQSKESDGLEDASTTRLHPLVWAKMYLSLEMFDGTSWSEEKNGRTVLHVASRFRNALDPGEYPYPFWHSERKWDSYQFSSETLFFIEGGKVIGALRSAKQDRARPFIAHAFDEHWEQPPPTTLFRRLFSSSNPHVPELENAYRAFENESRQYRCQDCHRPDNPAKQKPLDMICYPNQALEARHSIVRALETKTMPPQGIASDEDRARLIELARAFEKTAETTLAAEIKAR